MTPQERRQELESIADEVRSCTRCRLHESRTLAVPGEGDANTEVLFVGEGPGFNEDRQGRPFVGQAGNLLNELIGAIGWRRQDVFITNVVKCRPPENRDPEPDEIAACAPYLRRQLEILDPAVVVTLGRHSLQTFMPGARIGATHGTQRPADPSTGARAASAYAMYHPAAALRQASLRRTMLEDMCGLPEALIAARRRRAEQGAPKVEAQAEARSETRPSVATRAPEPPAVGAPDPPTVAVPDRPAIAAPDPATSVPAPVQPTTGPRPPTPVGVGAMTPDPDNQMELF